jgi:hypothetical protein
MISRRTILNLTVGATVIALSPRALRAGQAGQMPAPPLPGGGAVDAPAADAEAALATALAESDTVYLTPLRSDGTESRCQAEVWFVLDGPDLCVVTAVGAWRARAVRAGLYRARLWVGDLGVWTRTEGRYRNLPMLEASGAFITGADEQARVLELFGSKYPVSWVLWGPRFRNGLADGSRVMLRYRHDAG